MLPVSPTPVRIAPPDAGPSDQNAHDAAARKSMSARRKSGWASVQRITTISKIIAHREEQKSEAERLAFEAQFEKLVVEEDALAKERRRAGWMHDKMEDEEMQHDMFATRGHAVPSLLL
jgi:hypothetical protein